MSAAKKAVLLLIAVYLLGFATAWLVQNVHITIG